VLGLPPTRFDYPASLFALSFGVGFHEEELVVAGRSVRSEVGGNEEEA
jgi:hypothetical protein